MIIHHCAQLSEEWFSIRCGIPTASNFDRIVTASGAVSRQAPAYMCELLCERILGKPLERPESKWMVRGTELESAAISAYEFHTERETQPVGIVTNDSRTIGASPDRLIDEDGILELKAPSPQVHVKYMLERCVDRDYWPQLQGQLYVTERSFTDILSFHPEMPHVVIRVERDEKFINLLASALDTFVEKLQSNMQILIDSYGPFIPKDVIPINAKHILDDSDVEMIVGAYRERGEWND